MVAPGLPPLPPEAELVVYRVAQEALTNAHRHADAGTSSCRSRRLGDHVVLEVADDGRGCRDLAPGAGCEGCVSGPLLVAGRASVISAAARSGTTVRLSVPAEHP